MTATSDTWFRRRAAWIVAAAASVGLAWWLWAPERDHSLEQLLATGVLRVGYAVEPPYALVLPDGSVSGESAELARMVGERLRVRVEWIRTPFERLIPQLEAGRFDLIAAGMFIDAQRAERVRFTRPTLRVRPGWLVVAGNPKGLGRYEQLAALPGVRVAVLAGSVEQRSLQRLALAGAVLSVVPDAQAGLAMVATGGADALALSLPTVAQMAASSGGQLAALAAGGDGQRAALVALAVRHDAAALQRAIDAVLAPYIGSAEHLRLLQRFSLTADDLPRPDELRGAGPR